MIVGRLAVAFSQLEYFVAMILETMVNTREAVAAGIVTEEVPLRSKIRYVRKLANLHFAINSDLRKELNALLRDVDRERTKRNLFVHGQWDFSGICTDPPTVSCRDPRWVYAETEKSQHWERLRHFRWTLEELNQYLTTLNRIGERTEKVWYAVQNELRPKPTTIKPNR